jgi:hypothetical protein
VAPYDPDRVPTEAEEKSLIFFDTEEWVVDVDKTQQVSAELLK